MAHGGPQCAVQRVGCQFRGVHLPRAQPTQLSAHFLGPHASGIEQRRTLHQRDRGAPGGHHRPTPVRFEAGSDDPFAVDGNIHAHNVPASRAAGCA